MSITTGQQISNFYELFKSIDVTFNKEVIRTTGLVAQQVFLKCLGDQWPCIIYSASMTGAKIVANIRSSFFEKIRRANNLVSLRFSFRQQDKNDPVTFFVAAKIVGFNPYSKENPELNFMTLTFTQRPPDDLIEVLGKLLQANVNSQKRKEYRIEITAESVRKLGLKSKEALLFVQQVPRRCIIRDISFSGAKVIIMGVAKFLVEKECMLRIEMEEPNETLNMTGSVLRFEEVEGRKDLAALALQFDEAVIPMSYKMRVNDFINQSRKPGSSASSAPPPADPGPSRTPPAGQ